MANFTNLDLADAAKAVGSIRLAVMKIGDLCNGYRSVSFTNAQCDLQKVRNAQNYLPYFKLKDFYKTDLGVYKNLKTEKDDSMNVLEKFMKERGKLQNDTVMDWWLLKPKASLKQAENISKSG